VHRGAGPHRGRQRRRRRALPGEGQRAAGRLLRAPQPARVRRRVVRNSEAEGYVDTLFPGAFRRGIFEKVGLFDEGAPTNEDAEINQRILQAGGRLYQSREIHCYYYPRNSLSALATQYFRYGQGRARTLLKHRRFVTLRPALPFPRALDRDRRGARRSTGRGRGSGDVRCRRGIEAVRVSRRFEAPVGVTWLAFPAMHFPHALGFGVGLVRFLLRPNWTRPQLDRRGDATPAAP
jgi:hypothetical protein